MIVTRVTGKAMAKRCHFGFDMDGVFYNRSKINTADTSRYGARLMDTVEEVLAAADFVSLARAVVKTGISSMRNGWP